MSSVALDDSVQKLNEFCGLLEQTQADLQTELDNFERLTEQFDELEDASQERIGGLADDLRDAIEKVGTGTEEAEREIDDLTEAAQTGEGKLNDAGGDIEEARETLTERLTEGRSDLDEHFGTLLSAGFEPVRTAAEAAASGLEESGRGVEEAFTEAEGEVRKEAERLETAGDQVERAFGEAATSLDHAEQGLDQACEQTAGAWNGEVLGEVASESAASAQDVETAYGEFMGEVATAMESLAQGVSSEGQATAEMLGTQAVQEVEQGFRTHATDPLGDWLVGAAGLLAPLNDVEGVCPELDRMVDDLAIVRVVIADIDRLLEAM